MLAVILNSIIVKIIYLLGVSASTAADKQIFWGQKSLGYSLKLMVEYIQKAVTKFNYFPVLVFDISVIIGFLIGIVQTYKKQNYMIMLLYVCMILSNFAISIIQLNRVMFRTCTSWGLFVAVIVIILYNYLKEKKMTRIISYVFITILILQQTKYLNQFFYNDYIRYQKDLHVAYELIDRLEEGYNISKPLVITGMPEKSIGEYGNQSNGLSILWWGKKAFEGTGSEYIKFLNSLGYDFKIPTEEQYKKGNEEAKNMNTYPKEGAIKELEECIVINF